MSSANKTPITTITGELQTGKTTTGIKIKEKLLENKEQPGVVANDIDTGVDAERYDLPPELTEDIENICIGCGGVGELTKAITENSELTEESDHILVEPTGKANPTEVLENLYELEDNEEDIEVENMLYVLSMKDVEDNSVQALERAQRGIKSANAVVYSFPNLVETQTIQEADSWVNEVSENTKTYRIDDINWQEIREQTEKPTRKESTGKIETNNSIDFYAQNISLGIRTNNQDHEHTGSETVMPVSYELTEEEFTESIKEASESLEKKTFLKGFTPSGNAWNYNPETGDVEIYELEQGKTPCITNPGEDAKETFYEKLKQTGVIPNESPVFTPGTKRENVEASLQKQKEAAQYESVKQQLEMRGEIAEDFEATDTYLADATAAYQIWNEEDLLKPAEEQYLKKAHEAYNILNQEDDFNTPRDQITFAVQAGKIIDYSQTEAEKLAGIDSETYQTIEENFYRTLSEFNEEHARELASREDEADYHNWFSSLIESSQQSGEISNSIARAYNEADITASETLLTHGEVQ